MQHFYDRATMAHALTLNLDPRLHRLLSERIGALGDDLIDWTEYLVVEPGDSEDGIVCHIGISPLVDPMDGVRFGDPAFQPHWAWLSDHGGWFEMIFTFGSTFAYVLFIQDADGVNPSLRRLCRDQADG